VSAKTKISESRPASQPSSDFTSEINNAAVGNAAACERCGKPLHPKPGSRRQRFCNDACRQAHHRHPNRPEKPPENRAGAAVHSLKPGGMHLDPSAPLSRSNSPDVETVESIERDLIAGLGDLRDLDPKRRAFWLRRARVAAEQEIAARTQQRPDARAAVLRAQFLAQEANNPEGKDSYE
jgi:hypothetical protein